MALRVGGTLLTLVLACQPAMEIDFVRPGLTTVQPVAAVAPKGTDGLLQLQLVLVGSPSWWALTPQDRIQVNTAVYPLSTLKSESFVVSIGDGAPNDLRYRPRQRDLAVVLVMDNSESAAVWDPDGLRLVLAARAMDSLASMVDGGLLDSVVASVVELRGGAVRVVTHQQPDLAGAARQLAALSSPGGRAPLWDGVVEAGKLTPQGVDAVVLLYWGSSGDGESEATRDQALAVSRQMALFVVQGPGGDAGPLELARAGGGTLLRVPTPNRMLETAPVLSALARGVWELDLDVGGVTGERTAGQITLELEASRWSRAFDVPLFRR